MQIFLQVVHAIIALPKIGIMIEKSIVGFMGWLSTRQKLDAKKRVQDALLATRKAKNKVERQDAAKKWRTAIFD